MKVGKVGMIWEIRKRVMGEKKTKPEATAIINPKTNKLVVTKSEVKAVTLNYCKETLANNEPDKGFEELILYKQKYIADKMKETQGSFSIKKKHLTLF